MIYVTANYKYVAAIILKIFISLNLWERQNGEKRKSWKEYGLGKALPESIKLKVNAMFQTQSYKTASGLNPSETKTAEPTGVNGISGRNSAAS